MCTFLHGKISAPSLGYLQPPYHTSRWFRLFYNKGTHHRSCCFKLFASSYYLLFFFSWASESNLPVLARSILPTPSPGLTHSCWDREVTKGFAAAHTPSRALCKVACHIAGNAKYDERSFRARRFSSQHQLLLVWDESRWSCCNLRQLQQSREWAALPSPEPSHRLCRGLPHLLMMFYAAAAVWVPQSHKWSALPMAPVWRPEPVWHTGTSSRTY